MKYIFLIFLFFLSCICQKKYDFSDCKNVHAIYQYKILSSTIIEHGTFKAHVFVGFPDSILVSYDLIACTAIEICKDESIIEGYFYNNEDCLKADSINFISNFDGRNFYDCYLGSLKTKWSENWKEKLDPSEYNFPIPAVEIKF